MPAKPIWYNRLEQIVGELQALSSSWVDRATVEKIVGVGPRRAQQLMAPCIAITVGTSGVADRDSLVAHLQRLAEREDAEYEVRRRRRFAETYHRMRQERLDTPQVLVEAPVEVEHQVFEHLPPGIEVSPGRITVTFSSPREALEKLLALAMAIGNDQGEFEARAEQATIPFR